MSAVNPKNKMRYLIDFHCHSVRSFDAFSTSAQLLQTCLVKGINVLAITEHDIACKMNVADFKQQGIDIISGCEFTSDLGAHIIGLFIDSCLPKGSSREAIFDFILTAGGVILLPHPWKAGSGYFTYYAEDSLLTQVSLMELYNGGWDSSMHRDDIINIAKIYDIKLVGASDAHKAWQLAYFVSEYVVSEATDIKRMIIDMQPAICVDSSYKIAPRGLNGMQKNSIYQSFILLVPFFIKRYFKLASYWYKSRRYRPVPANYQCIFPLVTSD